jgi:hypothetical protein
VNGFCCGISGSIQCGNRIVFPKNLVRNDLAWLPGNKCGQTSIPTTRVLKIIVLGCVLTAVAITLKVRLDTPQGPQPLARAIVTMHLQQVRGELALP